MDIIIGIRGMFGFTLHRGRALGRNYLATIIPSKSDTETRVITGMTIMITTGAIMTIVITTNDSAAYK
jgi:hypothetical protein